MTDASTTYDLAILGCGLMGSAAARHASKTGARVALIGPPEQPKTAWATREAFGAHYDEGRITRMTDPDATWAALAARSIERYAEIAEEGGIDFFSEVGHLAVGPAGAANLVKRASNARAQGVPCEELDEDALVSRFPYTRFPAGSAAVWEPRRSGYISARRLVAAQVAAAERLGCQVLPHEALAVSGDADTGFSITLGDGATTRALARRVLVATGAFCNARPLLPQRGGEAHHKLDVAVRTTQTCHFVLSDADAARLAGMPSIIYKGETFWCYVLPPIAYPDGTTRLKLGGARQPAAGSGQPTPGTRELHDAAEMSAWYRSGGDTVAAAEMEAMLHELVPGLAPLRVINDACANCTTPTGQAYIGQVEARLAVAVGGNGLAAKSSDEIGRLAAGAALSDEAGGCWDASQSTLPADVFAPRVRSAP